MSVKELVCVGTRDQKLGPLRLLPWRGPAPESTSIFSLVVRLHLGLASLSATPSFVCVFPSFFFINQLLSILLISSP